MICYKINIQKLVTFYTNKNELEIIMKVKYPNCNSKIKTILKNKQHAGITYRGLRTFSGGLGLVEHDNENKTKQQELKTASSSQTLASVPFARCCKRILK